MFVQTSHLIPEIPAAPYKNTENVTERVISISRFCGLPTKYTNFIPFAQMPDPTPNRPHTTMVLAYASVYYVQTMLPYKNK